MFKMLHKMFYNIKFMALPLLIVGVMAACAGEYEELYIGNELTPDGPYIELTLNANDVETRALTDTHTSFTDEERKLNSVDLFFYKTGAAPDSDVPVKVVSIEGKNHGDTHKVNLTDEEVKALFGVTEIDQEGNCIVYTVANVSEEDYGDLVKANATIAQLRTIKAKTSSFGANPQDFKGFAMFTKAATGDVITLKDKKAAGTVKLKNLAAKIDVFIKFDETLADKVAMSEDVPTAEVHILNGVTAVELNGFNKEILTDDDYYSIRVDADETDRRGIVALGTDDPFYATENGAWRWVTSDPYYTYPNSWEDNPLEQHGTSLILKVDWKDENSSTKTYPTYYSIPVNLKNQQIESNHYYRLKLNINSEGGKNIGEPLEIEGDWEVLDWGHATLESDLREVRYLEVNQKQKDIDGVEYTAVINGNQGLVTIPFLSSHAVKIKDVKVNYTSYVQFTSKGDRSEESISDPGESNPQDLNVTAFTRKYDDLIKEENNWHCASIDNVNHTITVKHNIGATVPQNGSTNNPNYYVPDKSEEYLYYTYYITITLQHEDSEQTFGGRETINIIHHPAIYISAEVNQSFNLTWKWGQGLGTDNQYDRHASGLTAYLYGFARVNQNAYGSAAYGGLAGITKNWTLSDIGSKRSENPIMYTVTATQLEEGSEYHIRDPRVTESNTLQSSGWTSAPHYINGRVDKTSGHTLTDYYPTNTSQAEEIKYALSPRYRMASSFGNPKNSITSLADAEKRCASYQEAGYPAGRWRLPTYGEMSFVTYLSKKKLIPPLFGGSVLIWKVDAKYWCAQGLYKVDDDGNLNPEENSGTRYVRCVYDDWYWVKDDGTPDKIETPYNVDGNFTNGTVFVWGDKKKNNPQNPEDKE